MYKDGFSAPTDKNERSLFDAGATNVRDNVTHSEYVKENDLRGVENTDKLTDMQHVSQVTGNNRKVKQIIIYSTDNTFETFTPH